MAFPCSHDDKPPSTACSPLHLLRNKSRAAAALEQRVAIGVGGRFQHRAGHAECLGRVEQSPSAGRPGRWEHVGRGAVSALLATGASPGWDHRKTKQVEEVCTQPFTQGLSGRGGCFSGSHKIQFWSHCLKEEVQWAAQLLSRAGGFVGSPGGSCSCVALP